MLGKLSKGLQSIGVKLPGEAEKAVGVAEALEKGGLNADSLSQGLKDLVDKKTEAPPPQKEEMKSKLDTMTELVMSGKLTPNTISTLVQIMSAITAGDFEKAKALAGTLVTGDDALKNLSIIQEVLSMVKQ